MFNYWQSPRGCDENFRIFGLVLNIIQVPFAKARKDFYFSELEDEDLVALFFLISSWSETVSITFISRYARKIFLKNCFKLCL